jgi:8-oxo-dGTP diphosphatase
MPTGKAPRKPANPDEAAFLSRYDPSQYDQVAVAVDVVLLSTHEQTLRTLLVKRDDFPFKGNFALPGGFVAARENLAEAAARVCKVKAGIGDLYLEQLFTFGDADRDPRMRVISVAYYALIEASRFAELVATGTSTVATLRVPWRGEAGGAITVHVENGPPLPLAFDHDRILGRVVKRLRGKLSYSPLCLALLGKNFTLLGLQHVHEAILGHALNKDAFRRKILASGWIRPTGAWQTGVVHRPAELYTATAEARKILAEA